MYKRQQKDPALEKLKPDKTFYLAFDDYSVKNPHYHHDKFYPIDTMALISKDTKTHQINHVSLKVKIVMNRYSYRAQVSYLTLNKSNIC